MYIVHIYTFISRDSEGPKTFSILNIQFIQIYCNDNTNIISLLKDESWAGKKKRVNSDFLRSTKQFKVLTVVLSIVT